MKHTALDAENGRRDEGTGPFAHPQCKCDAQEFWNGTKEQPPRKPLEGLQTKDLHRRQEHLAHRAGPGRMSTFPLASTRTRRGFCS